MKVWIDKLQQLNLELEHGMNIGFGHNRWATHGVKNDINAHPHLSNMGNFSIVHNGIIENYYQLKKELLHQGIEFSSETDSEPRRVAISRRLPADPNHHDMTAGSAMLPQSCPQQFPSRHSREHPMRQSVR
mgnify:CR=1 FL=1